MFQTERMASYSLAPDRFFYKLQTWQRKIRFPTWLQWELSRKHKSQKSYSPLPSNIFFVPVIIFASILTTLFLLLSVEYQYRYHSNEESQCNGEHQDGQLKITQYIRVLLAKYERKVEVLVSCVRQPLVSEFFWRKVLAAGLRAVEFCGALPCPVEPCGRAVEPCCSGYHSQNIPLSDLLQLTSWRK